MSDSKKIKRARRVRTALIVLCVILSIILTAIIGVYIYIDHMLGHLNIVTDHTTRSSEEAASIAQDEWETIHPDDTDHVEETVTIPTDPGTIVEQGGHIVNIMLIGQDRRPGEGTQRSDSMILATFNKSTKEIWLTSIMRDQYVNIPGHGKDKLCHSYYYGGMPLLDQTLYDHFGIEIDGNVEVDFSGFEKIIDLLGGVEVDVSKAEARYIRNNYDMDLEVGLTTLTGEEALIYSRIRHLDSDYKRAERQREVIMSLFDKYKSQSLTSMLSMIDDILPLVTTDIPKNQIIGYAMELFPMLSGTEIQSQRIPVDGTFTEGYVKVSSSHKMWCQYNIDFEANREILRKIFAE